MRARVGSGVERQQGRGEPELMRLIRREKPVAEEDGSRLTEQGLLDILLRAGEGKPVGDTEWASVAETIVNCPSDVDGPGFNRGIYIIALEKMLGNLRIGLITKEGVSEALFRVARDGDPETRRTVSTGSNTGQDTGGKPRKMDAIRLRK